MAELFATLGVLTLMFIPVAFLIALVKTVFRKPNKKKWWKFCGISSILLFVFAFFASVFGCDHNYVLVEETSPTCTKQGEAVYYCDKCDEENIEYSPKLGHDMRIEGRVEPTENLDGEIVRKCERCGYEEVEVVEKLGTISSEEKSVSSEASQEQLFSEKEETQAQKKQNDWKTVFSDGGFSEQEISSFDEMFNNVGITDFHDVELYENGIMHIVRGKIYDSDELQLNVTLENRKIILIELAGIPITTTEPYINWQGELKFNTVGTTESVDLYYDVDGGYMAKLDWENKTITAIE